MEPGIVTKVWARRDLDESLRLMTGYGLRHTQFNMSSVHASSMPEQIPPELAKRIRDSFERQSVEMVAISGTFNMIHPDRRVVAGGLRRLKTLAAACQAMGTKVITLCTGTRDPDDMWRWHPDNDGPDAWKGLLDALERALKIAEAEDLILAIEPEQANVIHSARGARLLLDHFGSRHLRIVIDPANLFVRAEPAEIVRLVDEAFDLLGDEIVIAHAKDRDAGGRFVAAGKGVLNYDHYITRLRWINFAGALVLHGLSEDEVPSCVDFLRQKMRTGES
jgi:sugar phosphate isomerase/epimerase